MNKYLFEINCTNCKENIDARSTAELDYIMRKHDKEKCEFKEVDNTKYYSSYYISIPSIARYRDEIDSALEELIDVRATIGSNTSVINTIEILNDLRLELDDMIY